MCDYGFENGQDFNLLKNEKVQQEGNRMVTRLIDDAVLTIEMAKEICMIQRNEKGKIARTYFMNLEKAWNSPEAVMARAIKMAEKKISSLQLQLEEQKPLVEFANTVSKSCDNILMRDMAKLLCDQHINIGEKKLYKLLREHDVLMRSNDPYQTYVDRGYFYVKEQPYSTPYGEKLNRTTLVTPKGQIWIVSKAKEWLKVS